MKQLAYALSGFLLAATAVSADAGAGLHEGDPCLADVWLEPTPGYWIDTTLNPDCLVEGHCSPFWAWVEPEPGYQIDQDCLLEYLP